MSGLRERAKKLQFRRVIMPGVNGLTEGKPTNIPRSGSRTVPVKPELTYDFSVDRGQLNTPSLGGGRTLLQRSMAIFGEIQRQLQEFDV